MTAAGVVGRAARVVTLYSFHHNRPWRTMDVNARARSSSARRARPSPHTRTAAHNTRRMYLVRNPIRFENALFDKLASLIGSLLGIVEHRGIVIGDKLYHIVLNQSTSLVLGDTKVPSNFMHSRDDIVGFTSMGDEELLVLAKKIVGEMSYRSTSGNNCQVFANRFGRAAAKNDFLERRTTIHMFRMCVMGTLVMILLFVCGDIFRRYYSGPEGMFVVAAFLGLFILAIWIMYAYFMIKFALEEENQLKDDFDNAVAKEETQMLMERQRDMRQRALSLRGDDPIVLDMKNRLATCIGNRNDTDAVLEYLEDYLEAQKGSTLAIMDAHGADSRKSLVKRLRRRSPMN